MRRSRPSEEIQSLLDMLFVQDHEIFKGLHINLQRSRLNGADLRGAHLQGADLRGAHLQGADLRGAHLQGADLSEALLRGTYLSEAHLQGAVLRRAELQAAFLTGAQLQGADLRDARLQVAFLTRAQLQGADLKGAHLQGVISTVRQEELLPSRLKNRIILSITKAQTGKASDLTGVTFAGGLSQEDLNFLNDCGLSDEKAEELREKLKPHIGKSASHKLPEDSGAITGSYTAEEAEQWIAEYNEAMSEVPEESDN